MVGEKVAEMELSEEEKAIEATKTAQAAADAAAKKAAEDEEFRRVAIVNGMDALRAELGESICAAKGPFVGMIKTFLSPGDAQDAIQHLNALCEKISTRARVKQIVIDKIDNPS